MHGVAERRASPPRATPYQVYTPQNQSPACPLCCLPLQAFTMQLPVTEAQAPGPTALAADASELLSDSDDADLDCGSDAAELDAADLALPWAQHCICLDRASLTSPARGPGVHFIRPSEPLNKGM